MEKRVTKKDYFKMIREVVAVADVDNKDELITFVDSQIELLNKKRNSVNSKKAAEIEAMVERVYESLVEIGRPATATEIAEKMGVSNQKASAYLKKLVETERVEKHSEKRVSYFNIKSED